MLFPNIIEGSARQGKKEFIQFLYISLGSLSELETQLLIASDLKYVVIDQKMYNDLERIRMMLLGLIKYIKNKK